MQNLTSCMDMKPIIETYTFVINDYGNRESSIVLKKISWAQPKVNKASVWKKPDDFDNEGKRN